MGTIIDQYNQGDCEIRQCVKTYQLAFMLAHSPMNILNPRLIVPSVVSFA